VKPSRVAYLTAFRMPIRVCFSDIDHAGIVYYPRFLHYFHLAMEEFFTDRFGLDYSEVLYKRNVSFPTVHVQCDFRKRLRYGDRLEIEVSILHLGRTSITWGYKGYRAGDENSLVVEGSNVTVCVKTDTFEKRAIPEWLRGGLKHFLTGSPPE
jgi:4-hydroxybenzoyl-CoA thioesterase